MFDLIIENGMVYDGTGNPWFKADIGIENGLISKIGNLQNVAAAERIDAAGLAVSPGFIDIHCHSDALMFLKDRNQGKIRQGVTTEVNGNCGQSLLTVTQENLALLKKMMEPFNGGAEVPWNWKGAGEYFDSVEKQGTMVNVASLVGHGTLRIAVMGYDKRDARDDEMETMKRLLAQAIDDGAFGLSSGLVYAPGNFVKSEELVELSKVAAAKGGIYTTHMRSESDELIEAVQETIAIGESTGIPIQISHHKAAGRANWGKCRKTLQLIDEARRKGIDVTCDAYPYVAGNSAMTSLLPPWAHEGGVDKLLERLRSPETRQRMRKDILDGIPGWQNFFHANGWENIVISSCLRNTSYEGKSIQTIADERSADPTEVLFDLLEEDVETLVLYFMIAEEDVTYILQHPAVMVGSDAILSPGKPHPRFYGTFPRVLAKYSRQEKAFSLQEAIRKMTSMPAQRLGIRDRGIIREGTWADITVFNPETVEDKATFIQPVQYAAGMEYVIVNGVVAVRKGNYTGSLSGKVIRKGR